MDNNFNQGQPQQPFNQGQPQQPFNQGQPQQSFNQGQPQPMYNTPKQPPKFNVKQLVAIICSGVGAFLAILGTSLTCSCSAKKFNETGAHSLSAVFIVTIFAVIIAAVGIVFGILAKKDKAAAVKAGKLSDIAILIGGVAIVYGLLPLFTICGYNCVLKDSVTPSLNNLSNLFG